MLVKEVFEVVKNEGLLNVLADHIVSEMEEDGFNSSIKEMISEHTDSDRFAGWLESDAEDFDIDFEQLEEVWEVYQKEIVKYVITVAEKRVASLTFEDKLKHLGKSIELNLDFS